MGGASLIENWILEGDEQGNFSVTAFFYMHRFWLKLFGSQVIK